MIRLGIFVFSLLILPFIGLWISGAEWNTAPANIVEAGIIIPATLLTTITLLGYVFLTSHMVKLYTGTNPLSVQRNYYFAVSGSSAVLGWILVYLNYYVASWVPLHGNLALEILLYTPLFALLAPAILSTRALLGSFKGLLKLLSRGIRFPDFQAEKLSFTLLAFSAIGLIGGAAFPEQLFGLLWLSPLLLLIAMQLLWNESTIFSGLKSGDWGRVVCVTLSSIIVCNITVMAYQSNGGSVLINISNSAYVQIGYAAFGLLCVQLSDVIAENWRGKKRMELFQQKKKFPIPVVVKKD
ncbi:MAG: hypothetical protein HOO95_08175 [Gallionella sp.]|nr:hypothetical protein [Gallionella sp.]